MDLIQLHVRYLVASVIMICTVLNAVASPATLYTGCIPSMMMTIVCHSHGAQNKLSYIVVLRLPSVYM